MSEWDWQDQAVCRGDIQFTDRPQDEQAAACRRCPVRFECLELGIEQARGNANSSVGFGGRSPEDLLVLARARRARPSLVRCAECGVRFDSRSAVAEYCSKACRQKAYQHSVRVERT